jgi:prolyl-tRNA editing enzyme YbaK/EbsC (Cys-tRNA(Pro) deacylase)
VLSSNKNVNLAKLKKFLKAKKVAIPKETELVKAFKIKPGSLTGFGSVHKLPVVVDKTFEKINQAIFSSGSLVESVRMKVKDYVKLEEPIRHAFSEAKKIKPKSKKSKTKRTKQTKQSRNKKSKSKKKKS